MGREKVFSAQPLKRGILEPQAIDKIEVRAKWRKGRGGASDEESKKLIRCKTIHPVSKAGNAKVQHKSQGADDLGLVQSRTAGIGIIRSQMNHDRGKVKKPEFIPGGSKLGSEPFTQGRIRMNFSLMQEVQIFLMRLPVL